MNNKLLSKKVQIQELLNKHCFNIYEYKHSVNKNEEDRFKQFMDSIDHRQRYLSLFDEELHIILDIIDHKWLISSLHYNRPDLILITPLGDEIYFMLLGYESFRYEIKL